jgi:adenylate cyclase class IV
MREIEIKFKVTDIDMLEKRLIEHGCELSEPILQRDVTYSKGGTATPYAQASEGDIILRIRHLAHTAEFNLKQQRSGEGDNVE